VHGPSLTLSHLTVRRPVETALDVGTGNGIQAILQHATAAASSRPTSTRGRSTSPRSTPT
jgi:hypothetical protein